MTSSFRAEMEIFLNCQDCKRQKSSSICVLLFSISKGKSARKIIDGSDGEMALPGNRDNPSSERACGHEASEVHFGKFKIPLIPFPDDAIYLSAPVPPLHQTEQRPAIIYFGRQFPDTAWLGRIIN